MSNETEKTKNENDVVVIKAQEKNEEAHSNEQMVLRAEQALTGE